MERKDKKIIDMERKEKKAILVSACLLGAACRYDGKSNEIPELEALRDRASLVPFCPEIYGGLTTPRSPAEIREGRVVTREGQDVTEQFDRGAQEALNMAKRLGCRAAILKERSPSCGSRMIYDGTFSGVKIKGMGRTASLLAKNQIHIYNEEEISECIRLLEEEAPACPSCCGKE